ncbi:MAG: DUF4870 domain-containing protein [Phycisphaerales bacterium]
MHAATSQFRDAWDGRGRVRDPHANEGERLYSLFAHLTLIAFHLGVPVAPALIMWAIKRDGTPFVEDHAREALNFQISLVVYSIALVPIGLVTCGVGWALYLPLYALGIVGMVLGAMAAHRGEYFRYPMCLRWVREPAPRG